MKKAPYRLFLLATMSSLLLTTIPAFASEKDDRIELAARQSYVFKTYLKGDDISIQSKDGNVTLTGTVAEESHLLLAGETLAGQPDVTSFDNRLKVKDRTPPAYTDAWLITKVKSTLLFHRNVNAVKTEVFAKNGAVTLRGEANSAAQKDLTTEYAKDVEGVKSVANEMTVVTAAMKQSQKTANTMDTLGESIDDASIIALVKITLVSHRSTSLLKTTVAVKNGEVTLGGKARNGAEKDLTTKLVSDVHGVKNVVNTMTVETP